MNIHFHTLVAEGVFEGGKLLLRLRRRWRDGTEAIRFEPSELLERLAAVIPVLSLSKGHAPEPTS